MNKENIFTFGVASLALVLLAAYFVLDSNMALPLSKFARPYMQTEQGQGFDINKFGNGKRIPFEAVR